MLSWQNSIYLFLFIIVNFPASAHCGRHLEMHNRTLHELCKAFYTCGLMTLRGQATLRLEQY